MNRVRKAFYEIVDALSDAGVDYAICGGWAVAIHGYPRATEDVDLLVASDDVARVKELARAAGFILRADTMTFRRNSDEEQVVHRISRVDREELVMLDLLEVGPAMREAWGQRVEFEIGGRKVWVLGMDDLIAMKRNAGRAQDLADVEALEKIRDGRD